MSLLSTRRRKGAAAWLHTRAVAHPVPTLLPPACPAHLQALLIDGQYLKARHRRAHAYAGLQDWNWALLNMQASRQQGPPRYSPLPLGTGASAGPASAA